MKFLLTLVCAGALAQAAAAATYRNPVGCGFQDPAPVEYRGVYYLAQSTGTGVALYTSTNLYQWTYMQSIFSHPIGHVIWAPELHIVNGAFYLYISDLEAGCYRPRLRVARSDSLTGPYILQPLYVTAAIDPGVLVTDSGDSYLLGSYFPGGGDGCGPSELHIWKMNGPGDIAVGFAPLTPSQPDQGWEWIVNEGPQALLHKGQVYCLYSANGADREDYCISYVKAPLSTLLTWTNGLWFKPPENPILHKRVAGPANPAYCGTADPGVWGPGHGLLVTGPNAMEQWYVYHRKRLTAIDWTRDLAIDRTFWLRPNYAAGRDVGDRLFMDGPTDSSDTTAPAAPAAPTYSGAFDASGGLGKAAKGLSYLSGNWTVTGDSALFQSDASAGLKLAQAAQESADSVVEAWVKLRPGQELDGRAGIGVWADAAHGMLFALCANGQMSVRNLNGSDTGWVNWPIACVGGACDFTRYHVLRLEKAGGHYVFYLDNRRIGSLEGYSGVARAAIAADHAAADFDALKLTRGYTETFEGPAERWGDSLNGRPAIGSWSVVALRPPGALEQPEWRVLRQNDLGLTEPLWQAAFYGPEAASYEFSASIAEVERGTASSFPKYGVYSCYHDEDNFSVAFIDAQYGVLATYGRVNGQVKAWQNAPLPAGFQASDFTTLRVVKSGSAQKFYVNGILLQTRTFNIPEGQTGLLVEDTRADYDDLTWIRGDNPLTLDFDADGVPDISDNAPLSPNPAQTDTDNDGIGDAAEYRSVALGAAYSETDGARLDLGSVSITRIFGDRLYVEDTTRAAAIALADALPDLPEGLALANLRGEMITLPSGERALNYASAVPAGAQTLEPLGMAGGAFATEAPNNSGLLVRMWGRISGSTGALEISDGWGAPAPLLLPEGALVAPGDFVVALGVVSRTDSGVKALRIAREADILTLN